MKRMPRFAALAAIFVFLGLSGAPPSAATTADEVRTFPFAHSVANVEVVAESLSRLRPEIVKGVPSSAGDVYYGEILGRASLEAARGASPLVPFLAVYENGLPASARYDANLNGDLADDPEVPFYGYPPVEGARSFLANVQWTTRSGEREIPVDWKIRIVLQPMEADALRPLFRAQLVHAMTATVTLDGKPHRAFLIDFNTDGLYTTDAEAGDGLFVDLDDDGRVLVDPLSQEFARLSEPIHMGPGVYQVVALDPEGGSLSLRQTGTADWVDPPQAGKAAPEFTYTDTEGRRVSLAGYRGRYVAVHFWASWCGFCRGQAPEIKAIHERYRDAGFEILGVSCDTDRARMEEFRAEYGHTWPTSFSEKGCKGDPVVGFYRPSGAGVAYLVGPDGTIENIYENMEKLSRRLGELIPGAASASR